MPTTPISWRALLTASSRCGRTMHSSFFIPFSSLNPQVRVGILRGRDERRYEPALDFPHRARLELLPAGVGHVEHVERVALLGGDLREGDVEVERGERARDCIGEAGLVGRAHLDDGTR